MTLSFDDFVLALRTELRLAEEKEINPEFRLAEDMELDSLDFFMLVVWLEELAGAAPGAADGLPIATIGEAFEAFVSLRGQAP